MRKQQKPPRYRGYRIRTARPGKPSVDLPIIWSPEVPTEAWEQVKRDPGIREATMYRSGRRFTQFRRP